MVKRDDGRSFYNDVNLERIFSDCADRRLGTFFCEGKNASQV